MTKATTYSSGSVRPPRAKATGTASSAAPRTASVAIRTGLWGSRSTQAPAGRPSSSIGRNSAAARRLTCSAVASRTIRARIGSASKVTWVPTRLTECDRNRYRKSATRSRLARISAAHRGAQAAGPQVGPHVADVLEAVRLRPGHTDGVPSGRQWSVGRPDRVLVLVVADDVVASRVGVSHGLPFAGVVGHPVLRRRARAGGARGGCGGPAGGPRRARPRWVRAPLGPARARPRGAGPVQRPSDARRAPP